MKIDLFSIMIESILEVIETVAFLVAIPVEEVDDEAGQADCISIKIDYTGFINGSMYIKAPYAFTPVLAANMLGIEEDDPNIMKKGEDAYKEVLNIICGNTLPKVFGKEPVFKLSMPQIAEDILKEIEEAGPKVVSRINLDIEDHIVSFWFTTDTDLPG